MKAKTFSVFLIFLLFFTFGSASSFASIVINELCADNDSSLFDSSGDSPDWLELYNTGETGVDLTGFFLSDSRKELFKWNFPAIILAPNTYLVVFCSDKDTTGSEIHTNFKLDKEGEFLALVSPDTAIIDSLSFPELGTDLSYCRLPDGDSIFVKTSSPTPGAANVFTRDVLTDSVYFSHESGFYNTELELRLSAKHKDDAIYYTLDGSDPTESSRKFTSPFSLDSTTVVRAKIILPDGKSSRIFSHIFYIHKSYELKSFPTLQIITDPDNLWDKTTGIYVNAAQGGNEWERTAAVIYFKTGGSVGFNVDAGIRIHGGASRKKSNKHSFRLYFRSEYGSGRLEYPIIPSAPVQNFDRLVLRAGYNDGWTHGTEKQRRATTYLRDQLIRDLFIELGYPASHGDFVHLYLNHEYWGLYNVSERYDNAFFESYLEHKEWDVIKPGADEVKNALEAAEGDMREWSKFEVWFNNANFSDSSKYYELGQWVDMDNLIDFYVINVWAQNSDWPRHNWYCARPKIEDGRWIFLPWDAEYSFGGGAAAFEHDINMMDVISSRTQYPLNFLLAGLAMSKHFAADVTERFNVLLETTLSETHLSQLLDQRAQQIERAIPFEGERWGQLYAPEFSYGAETWNLALESMKEFFTMRTDFVKQHFEIAFASAIEEPDDGGEQNSNGLSFSLYQNYPNPFNNTTTIRFSLPSETFVTVEIYDIHGRLVTTLANYRLFDSGEHQILWNGSNNSGEMVSSGVYVVQIKNGALKKVKKLMFLK